MKFQIELKDKSQDYKDAVKNRLEELGWTVYSSVTTGYGYITTCPYNGECAVYSDKRHCQITLNDLYNEPEKYCYKRKEKIEWFRVVAHLCNQSRPVIYSSLSKSREHFLENREESDYHFIHLEKVCEHEYERNN